MILTIVLIWWAFGAGVAMCEYHLIMKELNRPFILTFLAALITCMFGPFALAFDSTTCLDCGEMIQLKVFGLSVYKNSHCR